MITMKLVAARKFLAFLSMMFLATVLLMPNIARAQDTGSGGSQDISNKKVTLNLQNADIRSALTLLFNTVGANFSIASDVRGFVTVSLNDVPFQAALESILRASTMMPLTYRIENGVYTISPKQEDNTNTYAPTQQENTSTSSSTTTPSLPKRFTKIPVNFADAGEIALLLGGTPIISYYYNTAGMLGMNNMGGGYGGYGNGFGGGGFGGYGGYGNTFGGGYGGFGGGYGVFGGGFGNTFGGGYGGIGGGFGNTFGGGYGGYNNYGGYNSGGYRGY
jgi:hypothetical protein